jgi:hypothetical protein
MCMGVASWDGLAWQGLVNKGCGQGLAMQRDDGTFDWMYVYDFAVFGDRLIAAGDFNVAIVGDDCEPYAPARRIASWDEEARNWRPLADGLDGNPDEYTFGYTLQEHAGELVVGGGFATAGGQGAPFIARWGCPACYPDFTGDGELDLFDFLEYVNAFNADENRADCTGDGLFDLFDFLCFVNAFNGGC